MSSKGFTKLLVESWSNAARTVRVVVILGGLHTVFEHTTSANRSLASESFSLEPYNHVLPISASASVAAPVRRGELYFRISVVWSNSVVRRLSAGYLTDGKTMSWPPGVYEGFTEGPGLIRTLTGTNPAVGVELTEAVPTNAIWNLKAVSFQLVAGVVAVDVQFRLDDGTDPFWAFVPPQIGAGLTRTFYLAKDTEEDAAYDANFGGLRIRLPDVKLEAGYRFATAAITADDDYGAPLLLVEEWIQE